MSQATAARACFKSPSVALALGITLAATLVIAGIAPAQETLRMIRTDTIGAGWTAESLANLEIGMTPERSVSYRFRADHDGPLAAVRVYFIYRTICAKGCYAAGDGGVIRVDVRDDDGSDAHLPGTTVLATGLVPDPLTKWNRLIVFSRAAPLQSGRLYHLAFTNVSLDPLANYVSIDDLYTTADGAESHPSAEAAGLAVLLRTSARAMWERKPHHLPIFSLTYGDGYRQGQTYVDVKQAGVTVSGGSRVREVFTMGGAAASVSSVGVRVKALVGGGKLRITLTTASGQVIETALAPVTAGPGQSVWVSAPLATRPVLARGASYAVVLEGVEGGAYIVLPLESGASYGFDTTRSLAASHCEASKGAEWQGCLGRRDLDVPFYLRIAN